MNSILKLKIGKKGGMGDWPVEKVVALLLILAVTIAVLVFIIKGGTFMNGIFG